MSVKARLYVSEISRFAYNPSLVTVKLQAVSRGGANAQWASATPSAQFQMTIGNQPASDWFLSMFEEGQEVEVTFDPAPSE